MNPTSKINVPAKVSPFLMMARLAAAVALAALLVPCAFAQSHFIYVANAGDDTVSKIDITTDTEVARYATWFTSADPNYNNYPHGVKGPAPSRIARDTAGYFYVLNRFFPENSPGGTIVTPMHRPVLLKIAPFGGVLGTTTSNGAGSAAVLKMHDSNPQSNSTNDQIDPGEATDVRILWGQPIGTAGVHEGALGRALCMDPSGYLWVGMHDTKQYYKVDPATGTVVGPPVELGPPAFNPGHTPYGCQVDTQGRLWSVGYNSLGSYPGHTLAEIDTITHQVKAIHDHGPNNPPPKNYGRNYSLSLFNGCGSEPTKVYLSEWGLGRTYIAYDPQTNSFSNPPGTGSPPVPLFNSVSIGVDLNGNIISGQYGVGGGRVIKTTPAGAVLWDTSSPLVNSTVSTPNLHGIIIDSQNNVWAVDQANGQVIKYDGTSGALLAKVKVGNSPYTYGNPPAPTCPCAVTSEPQIKCEGKDKDGNWVYSWSFLVTNNSPFSMPATTVDLSIPAGSPITGLTPQPFKFATPGLPPKGQATVTGTFTLAQPLPGTEICFDIRLNAGEGWCCPLEHVCFIVPDCTCATLEGVFKCSHGHSYLDLSVTNLGPTAAAGAQIFSNTPGVAVSPPTTTLAFPQNTPVIVPLTVTGATPGQVISLSVMLHGPIDPKTGVHSWCCTATVKVIYPAKLCWWWPDGELFDDVNANGLRDSGEGGLPEWTVTLTSEGKGTPRTTKTDASGAYHFEEVEPGKYRLAVQPPKGWRATAPKDAVHSLSVEAPPKERLDFGFVKTRP
jgi:streptogramin lyase